MRNTMIPFSIDTYSQDVDLLVLMDTYEIEPILSLCTWSEEFDLSSLKSPVKPLIPHIANAI